MHDIALAAQLAEWLFYGLAIGATLLFVATVGLGAWWFLGESDSQRLFMIGWAVGFGLILGVVLLGALLGVMG